MYFLLCLTSFMSLLMNVQLFKLNTNLNIYILFFIYVNDYMFQLLKDWKTS